MKAWLLALDLLALVLYAAGGAWLCVAAWLVAVVVSHGAVFGAAVDPPEAHWINWSLAVVQVANAGLYLAWRAFA